MSFINTYEFKKCVNHYKGDRHAIKFTCRDQFMIMSFANELCSVHGQVRAERHRDYT